MTTKEFDNTNRDRYYGIRVGDTVELLFSSKTEKAEVIGYDFMDNNRIYIKTEDGTKTNWVAEWCKIITKVEDK